MERLKGQRKVGKMIEKFASAGPIAKNHGRKKIKGPKKIRNASKVTTILSSTVRLSLVWVGSFAY